jgi:hypothetical protein
MGFPLLADAENAPRLHFSQEWGDKLSSQANAFSGCHSGPSVDRCTFIRRTSAVACYIWRSGRFLRFEAFQLVLNPLLTTVAAPVFAGKSFLLFF